MLNLFGSISSVSYQFLVLESPFIQVIFMKKYAKNPLFEGLCYNLKGLELLWIPALSIALWLKGKRGILYFGVRHPRSGPIYIFVCIIMIILYL